MSHISKGNEIVLGNPNTLANFQIPASFNGTWINVPINTVASTLTPGKLSNENFQMNIEQGCAFFTATGSAAGTFGDTHTGLVLMPLMGARYKTIGAHTVGLLFNGTENAIELKGDDANGKGFEIYFPRTYSIDAGLSHQAVLKTITDVSGITSLAVGWRTAGSTAAAYTSYNDYAAIVIKRDTSNPAKVYAEARTNGGVAGSQDTGQTIADDASDVTLKVTLAEGGTNTIGFFVNGIDVSSVLATTFPASGDIVPFIELICHTDTVGSCTLSEWKGGLTTYFN